MNREQKRAWSILIGMSAAMVLSLTGFLIGGFKTYPSKAFLVLGAAALGAGVFVSFRFRPDPGAVSFDERDRIIANNAGVAGLGAVYLLMILVSYVPIAVAPDGSVPTKWFPFLLPAAGLCQGFATFVSVLIQYGRQGREHEDG